MIKRRRAASAVVAWDTSAKCARSKMHAGPAGELTGCFLSKKNHCELDFCLLVSVWRDLGLIILSLFHLSRHVSNGKKGGRGVSQKVVPKTKAKRKSGAARRAKKMAAQSV